MHIVIEKIRAATSLDFALKKCSDSRQCNIVRTSKLEIDGAFVRVLVSSIRRKHKSYAFKNILAYDTVCEVKQHRKENNCET